MKLKKLYNLPELPISREVLFEKTDKNLYRFTKAISCYDSNMEVNKYTTKNVKIELSSGYVICHFFPILAEHEFGVNSKITICKLSFVNNDIINCETNTTENINIMQYLFWEHKYKVVDLTPYGISSQFIAIPDTDVSKNIVLKLFVRMIEALYAYYYKQGIEPQSNMFVFDNFPIKPMCSMGRNYSKLFQSQQKRGVQTIIKKKYRVFAPGTIREGYLEDYKKRVSLYIEQEKKWVME